MEEKDLISQYKEYHKLDDKWEKEMREGIEQLKKMPKDANTQKNDFYGDCDHPNTLENSTATILYIIVMIGGAIFNDRWLIWIVATFVYFNFITRHTK